MADVDFVPLPGGSPARMIDKAYLKQRASLISRSKSMGVALPGDLGPTSLGVGGPIPENGTTQVTIVDAQGNVASMTTTVESGFGSFHMAKGGGSPAEQGDQTRPEFRRLGPRQKRPRSFEEIGLSPGCVEWDALRGERLVVERELVDRSPARDCTRCSARRRRGPRSCRARWSTTGRSA